MRICQVIDSLNVGGAERVCIDLCNILKKNNEDVNLLLLVSKGDLFELLDNNINYFILDRKNKYDLKKMYELSRYVRDFDIIHCHFRHVYRYIKLVCILFSIKNTKLILHDHYGSIDIDQSVPTSFNSLLRPNYYIGVSDSLVKWANSNLVGVSTYLLSNIIVPETKEVKLSKKFDLVLISNIKPIKNQLFAAEFAIKNNLSILFIGKNQDDTYFNKLKKACNYNNMDYEILQNVTNAQTYLNNAKFGLHVSRSETGPLVLLEYMAQKLPFITYATGEIAADVKHHFPSLIKENFNLDEWIETYQKASNNKRLGHDLQSFFYNKYGENNYYSRIKDIYSVINSK